MNGRVYDPKLARFLSADPNIQAPKDTQSLNRYSYVLNNPLSSTDPSGYFFKKLLQLVSSNPLTNAVAQGLSCFYGGPKGCAAYSAAVTWANGGSVGDILKSAAIAYASASTFEAIGDYGAELGKVAGGTWQVGAEVFVTGTQYAQIVGLHAITGGVVSVLNGGKFGHGFVSAGFTKSLGHAIGKIDNDLAQFAVTVIVGGTSSKLSGGKFANGASTATFQYLFNFKGDKKETNEERRALLRSYGINAQNLLDTASYLNELVDPSGDIENALKILNELVPQSKGMHPATLKLKLLIQRGSLVGFIGADGLNFSVTDVGKTAVLQFNAIYRSANALKFVANQLDVIDSLNIGETPIETRHSILKFYAERWKK